MSDKVEEFLAYITYLRDEHKRLEANLLEAEQHLQGVTHSGRKKQTQAELLLKLQELREELARHFEEEDSGGCLDEAVSHQPSLSHDLTRLEHEHPQLLATLDLIMAQLRRVSGTAKAHDLEAEFSNFAQCLRAHEAAESRMLETAFRLELE